MKCSSYESFFETISGKTRMKIITCLATGAKSVSEICASVKEEQSKVSHNLRKLLKCHFVDFKRSGKLKVYELNKDTILPILNLAEKHARKYCREECLHESLS
ncbi:MAG TPA: metalloregulator ArsR/SmtB family transcription factor [Candidatus Nanoarchaeia archaeon]|nr:metalloregulator ArsR/SmtB family transcription factor [Candidatus Nanoarchaeia archaeon]